MDLLDTHNNLVLFDGVCNLCTGSVKFILKREKDSELKFASLQSPDGILIMNEVKKRGPEIDSILLVQNGKLLTHSAAALNICRHLKFPFSLCVVFLVVPRALRDMVYNFIARNRYRFFGKQNECLMVLPGYKSRFLG